jgi:hypothetical protein
MQPNSQFCQSVHLKLLGSHGLAFGEFDKSNRLHGRGIQIKNGFICIGYFENGLSSTDSNYIRIFSSGNFRVGEIYLEDGRTWCRGTEYKTDGTEEQLDYLI